MIRNRICWGAVTAAAAVVFIFADTYYTFALLAAVIIIPLVSMAMMLAAAGGVSLELELPPSMEKGSSEMFSYTLKNTSRLPAARVSFRVRIENQLTFSSSVLKASSHVRGRSRSTLPFVIEDALTGATSVSTDNIRVQDALGIFCRKKKPLADRLTVVYPRMRDLEVYMDRAVETLGDGRRYAPDRKGEDVSELFAIRDYAPGDEIRKMHWKLSSKLDRAVVREFSLPLNYSVFLMLEMSRAEESVMDRAVELYFSISRRLLAAGINHNLAWYDGGSGQFNVRELKVFEDMDVALAELLTSFAYEEKSPALDHYAESVYCDPRSTLVYVSTDPDTEKLEEIALRQAVRTIDAGAEPDDGQPLEIWV